MRKLLSALLSLSLLSGPALLLPLHETQVARAESGHHLAAPSSTSAAPSDAHQHHEEADCRLCLGVVSSRLSPSQSAGVQAPAAAASALSGRAQSSVQSFLLASAAPRGPPSVS